jgi:hypothetical protein
MNSVIHLPTTGVPMRRSIAVIILFLTLPVLAVQTSHWTHNTEADFHKGTMHNVVATNLGDVKLSRAVKTILEEDAKVSAVYAMVEAADGTIYAATGPHGVLLKVKDNKASPVVEFDDNSSIFALLIDMKGSLVVGVSGEKGKVYRVDQPGAQGSKPVEIFADDEVQYIWGLQATPDGNLYIATGPNGKLFELNVAGKKSVIMSSDESNLLSLLSDGKDTLYVGTDPNGLVYRVNRKNKEVFVLFDAPESEISCLALDRKGNLYVGTAEAAEPAVRVPTIQIPEKSGRPEGTGGVPLPSTPPELPKPPVKPEPNPGEPEPIPKASAFTTRETIAILSMNHRIDFLLDNPSLPNPNRPGDKPKPGPATAPAQGATATPNTTMEAEPVAMPKPQGNAIYRIDPDGFVTEIFRQPVLVMSMLEKNGSLLVGTGSDGLIYEVNPATEETVVLAKVEPKQVLSLLASRDGRVLLGLANVGGIEAMDSGFATQGTLTSPVLDATQISRFGKVRLHGSLPAETSLTLATRSGNVQDPSKAGWSPWSEEIPAVEFVAVPSPSARFMQYRLTLTSKDAASTPLVNEVDVAYQMPNLAPVIKSVKVGAGSTPAAALIAAVTAAAAPNTTPTAPATDANRIQTISWEAEDANGDTLQYSLYFRSGSKAPWILLKDKLTDTHFDWDTRSVADGRYEVRVIASDAASNPPGTGKTATRVSSPVVIDNTPPVMGDVKSKVAGSEVTVSAKAVDRTSIVAAVEYAVDSSTDWQLVLPSNKIFDSPEETVNFTVRGLSAGAHQITLRATDGKGNQVFETVLVTVDPPTAQR